MSAMTTVRRAIAILNRWITERGGPVSLRERVELYDLALEQARAMERSAASR